MEIEYRWFKNGKEAMYTLDLEGDQVTKEFWDNGNIKMEITGVVRGKFVGKKTYNRDGVKLTSVWNDSDEINYTEYWGNGVEKTDWTIHRPSYRNISVEWKTLDENYKTQSRNGEPSTFLLDSEGEVSMFWAHKGANMVIDAYLKDIPPSIISFDENGIVKDMLYDNRSPDSLIESINMLGDDENRYRMNYRGEYGNIITVGLNEMPEDIEREFNKLMSRFNDCRKHYIEKYSDQDNKVFKIT